MKREEEDVMRLSCFGGLAKPFGHSMTIKCLWSSEQPDVLNAGEALSRFSHSAV
jgi:hypothetical protein